MTGVAALLLIPLLAACAAGPGHVAARSPSAGRVTGKFLLEGGPLGPGGTQPTARPIPGLIQFSSARRRVSVRVGSSGIFQVSLPPGRYAVKGYSPYVSQAGGNGTEIPCSQPISVRITADQIARITVTCVVP